MTDSGSGRAEGESPLFPPQHANAQQAKAELEALLEQPPERFARPGARWKLSTVRDALGWLTGRSLSGVWRILWRAKLRLKRGQARLYSPDPDYAAKLAYILRLILEAKGSGGRVVVVFCDELTYYRQPSVAPVYAPAGRRQPRVSLSHARNSSWRVVGALDVCDAKVTFLQGSKIGTATMTRLCAKVVAAYAQAEKIYIVVDNWPVHFHPDVLAALEPQEQPFPLYTPASWAGVVSTKTRRNLLPVQLVPTPTYAPSTNPIEKLWRWLKAEVVHMHPHADTFDHLKQKIDQFLTTFAHGSAELLRYVGLTPDSMAYGAAYQDSA